MSTEFEINVTIIFYFNHFAIKVSNKKYMNSIHNKFKNFTSIPGQQHHLFLYATSLARHAMQCNASFSSIYKYNGI